MEIRTLVSILDEPHLAADYLAGWGLYDVARGRQAVVDLAETGVTLDLLAVVCQQLSEHLPQTADPDTTLDAFRRYFVAVRSPLSLAGLLERQPTAMSVLLTALSLGPRWTELLIGDPDALDVLLQTEGHPIDDDTLAGELQADLESFSEDRSVVATLARFRCCQLLRIAYGETTGVLSLEATQSALSLVGQTLVAGALTAAMRKIVQSRPWPTQVDRQRLRYGIIAVGELGGSEAGYHLPLELLVLYEAPVNDAAALRQIHDQFERIVRLMGRWLDESAMDDGCPTLRFICLPDSSIQAIAHTADDVVIGFDSFGRTWHRHEMLKARPIVGDQALCQSVLDRLDPWLFRRYLSRADEIGIKALKRRILVEGTIHQDDWRNLRSARGGLDNLESTVEFLQLLVGGEQSAARRAGTLAALAGLESAGAIAAQERGTLEEVYRFLRRLLNRLQIAVTPQCVALPEEAPLLERLAREILVNGDGTALVNELKRRLDDSWQVLRKLLTAAFESDAPVAREVELLLAPQPPVEEIRAALAPFGFDNPERALESLNDLASEQVPFLSTRRCRHSLGQILPRLLCAIAATPQPDETLDHLVRVSSSVGGKGVLWDLFRSNPPSLELYVRLCAASPYLSNILTTNPGMIDELIDSLQLDKLPSRADLEVTLAELCRGATDTLPILHDFKNAEHLRIGVRDILGKEDIDLTHAALAEVAETCLAHVTRVEHRRLVEKFGEPRVGVGPREGQPARLVIVGLGKFGGREPNYHSPLDVLFLYEADGLTRPTTRGRSQERTANNHFFTQLAQRVIKAISELTAKGRLYEIDTILRPIGTIGALAMPMADFTAHFSAGAAPVWQWQALCQARPVVGEADAAQDVERTIRDLLRQRAWSSHDAAQLCARRKELERGASSNNIKRGPGGTLDIEFVVQMLQLQHATSKPELLVTNTQAAIVALAEADLLSEQAADRMGQAYRFLRRVESGLRLMETKARHDLPTDPTEMRRLALLLGHGNADRLREQCLDYMSANREQFDRLFGEC